MSKEQLLVDQETPDLQDETPGIQDETPQTIQRHYSLVTPSQFDSRTRLTGFGETSVPLQVAISSRYCCVLFEPDNSYQKYNIYQRYTNARLYQGEASVVIKDFFIYDPMDCGIKSTHCNGEAYLLLLLTKPSEFGEYIFQVIRISQTNQFKSMSLKVTRGRWQYVRFASVACDLSYFAIALIDEEVPPERKSRGDNRSVSKAKFLEIKDDNLVEVSSTEDVLVFNKLDLYCKATFVGKTGRALVLIREAQLSLVQVSSGKALSKIEIQSNDGVELGYYFDINQYFYISKFEEKEWRINIDQDQIELEEATPIIHFDLTDPPNFSYDVVPYQYSSYEMPSIYSNTNMSSFSVDQKSFEFTLNNMRYSRSVILPNLKVFYTISAQEPHDILVIEMNNLDVQFLTTFSTNQLIFSADNSKGFTQMIIHDNNLQKSDVTQGLTILQKLSSYLTDKIQYRKFQISQIKDFQVSGGKFMTVKVNNQYMVFDLEKNKCVGQYIGLKLNFSENGLAFVVHICGNNFSYWSWDEYSEEFVNTLPLIKNVASRVDFFPGSHQKLVIYDEFYHSIMLRDTVENSVDILLKNVSFSSDQYKLVTDNLILYSELKFIGSQKSQVSVLYNLNSQYEEIQYSGTDTITDIKLSKDKCFLYVATNQGISVYESHNLSNKICSYSIGNVHHILENDDQTYLIVKLDNSYQIFGVKTLNPKEKCRTISSGSLIMKYIVTALHDEENLLKQHSVKAYVQFQRQGMIDSFFEPNGETFLHYLIRDHPSDLLKAYLKYSETKLVYNNSFGGESPLTLAFRLKKMQHLNMIIEHFIEYPNLIEVNSEDVLTLMECGLSSAAVLVPQLFQKPNFHKCALPYSMPQDKDIIIVEQPSVNIGLPMVAQVQKLMEDSGCQEEKVYEYSITKFSYNFARGSKSSIQFLDMYANQDSEEILRSDLRFIILQKFEECKFFLIMQAGLFFAMLFLVFLKLIYFPESWLFLILIFIFNTLFLGYELNQLIRGGFADYFDSLWNYIDMTGFILLYVVNIAYYSDKDIQKNESYGGYISFITVITILSLLLRGMSHLRIFSNLRYLINMIVEIMSDMSSFTIILVYWIIGLNVAFYMLSIAKIAAPSEDPQTQPEESDTTGDFLNNLKMTYRLAFGDFSPDEYNPLEWFLFVLGSCFIPLVLFNLIIAIMGDTYDRVQTSAKCVDLKEQANLVLEAEELLYWRRNAGNDRVQKTLICYNEEMGEGVASEAAEWEGKIKGLTKQMNRIETKLIDVSKMKDEIIREIKAHSKK